MITMENRLRLTDFEIQDGKYRESEYKWHPTKPCSYCGERMFWHPTWKRWLCRTWCYMEGGCMWEESIEETIGDKK